MGGALSCVPPFFCMKKVCENMNIAKDRYKKRIEYKDRVINKKDIEIESLKNRVSKLEIDNNEKDAIISSIDSLRVEMDEVVKELRNKSKEYDKLLADLFQMRKVMCRELFDGELRWKIIRLLMK